MVSSRHSRLALMLRNPLTLPAIGMELILYGLTVHTLLKNRRKLTRSDKFFIFLSTAMLFLITIFFSTEVVFGEEMWIVNADYPGGSAAYLGEYASVWYQTMGTTSSITLNLLTDALMVRYKFLRNNVPDRAELCPDISLLYRIQQLSHRHSSLYDLSCLRRYVVVSHGVPV